MARVRRYSPVYNTELPEQYLGNPFVEAMPPMMTMREYFKFSAYLPDFEPTRVNDAAELRKVKIAEVYKYFVPSKHIYRLYTTLWRMLFSTYTDRNSFDVEHVRRQYSLLLLKQDMDEDWEGTTGESLLLTAPSGFGKTIMTKRVLKSFPQVLQHNEYKQKPFNQAQVLWIYLKIPSNANRKSLCHLFLEEVDKCVGTDYAERTPTSTQIGKYEAIFRTIIETYKIGLLVVDEMQNLSVCKAGGDKEFLNFFSELSEQWQMGLVLVGTPDIMPILQKSFTATRRLTSGGDMHFQRYAQNDPIWEGLVKTLWRYQYVTNAETLYDENRKIINNKLFNDIYSLTQGIPFVFVFLLINAQFIAIDRAERSDLEKLDTSALRDAYNNSSRLIKCAIEDIKSTGGKNYADLMQQVLVKDAPEKIAFIAKLEYLLSKRTLSPKVAAEIRKEVEAIEEKYVLNDKEKKIIERLKASKLLANGQQSQGDVIDGQFEVVN